MSWNDFNVFYLIDDDIQKIKQSAFVYNHINVYQSKLCDWTQEENEEFNEVLEWLINNDILRVVATAEDIESDLKDKIYARGNRELMELINKNKDKIANPPKYPNGIEEALEEAVKKDQNDPFLEKILLMEHRRRHEAKYCESEYYRATFNSPVVPDEVKRAIKNKLEELYQIELSYYKKFLKESHRNYNEVIIDQFCTSYSTFINPFEFEYYEYKINRIRDFEALKMIKAVENILPLVDHYDIDDFSYKELEEIRKTQHWNGAMKHLAYIVENIPNSEDNNEFKEQLNQKVRNILFDVIEEHKGSVIKDTAKSATSLGIGLVPYVGPTIGTLKTVADPLINYLQENTNQNNLAYFLNDLRHIKKK